MKIKQADIYTAARSRISSLVDNLNLNSGISESITPYFKMAGHFQPFNLFWMDEALDGQPAYQFQIYSFNIHCSSEDITPSQ